MQSSVKKKRKKPRPQLSVTARPIASSSVHDTSLALIFSQLPHPECWMPRLPLEALNCFWLALPASGSLVLPWFSRVCVVLEFVSRSSLSFPCLYVCVCEQPPAAEACSTLWGACVSVVISLCCTGLPQFSTWFFSTPTLFPLPAQTFLILSTQTIFNPVVLCPNRQEF